MVCPENGDAALCVDWIPFTAGAGAGTAGGEYRIWCPTCGAQNVVLVRDRHTP